MLQINSTSFPCIQTEGWAHFKVGKDKAAHTDREHDEAAVTCAIFYILHLHDFSVDPTSEDIEGSIDGLGPLGRLFSPSDPAIVKTRQN